MRIALFTALAALLFAGCGDDPGTTSQRGFDGVKSAPKAAAAPKPGKTGDAPAAGAAGAGAGVDTAKLPPKLRDIDWSKSDDLSTSMRETRDPFAPYVDDIVVAKQDEEGTAAAPVTQIKSIVSDTPVEAMQLIAIITGGAVHKAMVTDQGGTGHIVRPGDIVGKEPPMRVVRITRNEVLFRALEVEADEEKPKEVQKVLLSQEELQELLP